MACRTGTVKRALVSTAKLWFLSVLSGCWYNRLSVSFLPERFLAGQRPALGSCCHSCSGSSRSHLIGRDDGRDLEAKVEGV